MQAGELLEILHGEFGLRGLQEEVTGGSRQRY